GAMFGPGIEDVEAGFFPCQIAYGLNGMTRSTAFVVFCVRRVENDESLKLGDEDVLFDSAVEGIVAKGSQEPH
ncbi:hypothetical protein ACXWQL_09430, partial [Streptococcus pyogenes]